MSTSLIASSGLIGSPWYWAFVGAVTLAFAVVDLLALSRRDLGRPQGAAIIVYVGVWGLVVGLGLPIAPLGSIWWVFPAAVRIAFFVVFAGGQIIADLVLAEQAIAHSQPAAPPPTSRARGLTEDELRVAQAFDALWQVEDRQRNEGPHPHHSHRADLEPDVEPTASGDEPVDFEALARQALDELPAHLLDVMSNVAIFVEAEPPPGERLLGLYEGVPLTGRSQGYVLVPPDKITIYRGPIERRCGSDRRKLERDVRRTVFHEIAHHFGISDARLLEIDRY